MNVANGFWIPMLRICGIPVMTNVDGIEWIRGKWGTLARRTFLSGARLTKKWSSLLVFDAEAIRQWWSDEFGSSGVVIEYGALAPTGVESPSNVDLSPGRYVLYVARLVPENSVMEFLEAAKALAANGIRVVIVGSDGVQGTLDDAVRELSSKEEDVVWLGRIEDDRLLFWLWSNAGVYFHGHSVGGTNPALVQAMWCGACVVARDTVFNREVLGDAGVFVEPEPALIAKTINDVLRNSKGRLEMRSRALTRARSNYSLDRINGLYDGELRKLSGLPLQGRVDSK
jgi:Glycosyltransferase